MSNGPNRMADEFAKMMNDAAGVAQGFKREVDGMIRAQAEKYLADMDLVHREEFDAVKDMAAQSIEEIERLKQEIAQLKDK